MSFLELENVFIETETCLHCKVGDVLYLVFVCQLNNYSVFTKLCFHSCS